VNFLIHEGWRAATAIHDATDDAVHGVFNTWFSLYRSSLDEVEEAQRLDNAVKEDDRVYHALWQYTRGSDDEGPSTS
jgi:chemotaxis regulatin CheY-phosphate phosphatase CheZ